MDMSEKEAAKFILESTDVGRAELLKVVHNSGSISVINTIIVVVAAAVIVII